MTRFPAERHRWLSPSTGCEIRVRRLGNRGRPFVYFPGSDGDETEFERYEMLAAVSSWLDSGQAQFFSIDGRGPATLWNEGIPPVERIRGYAAFERYAADELLPWIAGMVPGEPPIVVGSSYGAFVAANLLFKYPSKIGMACGLGGVYGMWHRLDGYHDDDVYFHTPLEYLPRLDDLEAIRATGGLTMFAGESDAWLDSTRRMGEVCRNKGLPHLVDVWAAPADHHERWWARQLQKFLGVYV